MSIPLEEAPFGVYLQILRENGREVDAEISETFYINILGQVASKDDLMKVSFKKIVEASEKVLEDAQLEALQQPQTVSYTGNMVVGADVPPHVLSHLAVRQQELIEQEKHRLRMY